ncbi:MAG: hypothetical protein ACOC3G_07845, partial [Phycisphaeraceae bacterium]
TTGREQGCSSGEWAALQLAQAVAEHAYKLDPQALHGFVAFVRVANRYPQRVSEIFGGLQAIR